MKRRIIGNRNLLAAGAGMVTTVCIRLFFVESREQVIGLAVALVIGEILILIGGD